MYRANSNYGEQTLGKCKRTCGFIERTKYQGLHCRNMYPNNFNYWHFHNLLEWYLENLNQNKEDIIDFIKACHSNTLSLISFFLNFLQESAFLDNFNTYFKREWVNQKGSFSACVYCKTLKWFVQNTKHSQLLKDDKEELYGCVFKK